MTPELKKMYKNKKPIWTKVGSASFAMGKQFLLQLFKGLFHYISTNAKYPRSENLYKMLIDHLYRMTQAIEKKILKSDSPLMRY